MSLLAIVLPIALLVAAGYLLGRRTSVEVQSLSRVTMYLFSPSLVFTVLLRADLDAADSLRLAGAVLAHLALMLSVGMLTARLLRLPAVERAGLVLATLIYNIGNYGLPVILFAYGQEGLRVAAVIFVLTAFVAVSLGIYLASAGRNVPLRALTDVFRLPSIYAAVLGLIGGQMGWSLPAALMRPLDMMAQAAIPLLLVALGVQLASARPATWSPALGAVTGLRLVVSPLVAVGVTLAFGVSGVARGVVVLAAGLPTAINAFLIASQFDSAPEFVANAVFATTLVSFATVTLILALMR